MSATTDSNRSRMIRIALAVFIAGYLAVYADSTIWTLELETTSGRTKLLTIQVRKQSRQIIQARGKRNRLPTEKERAIVVRWAAESGLTINC